MSSSVWSTKAIEQILFVHMLNEVVFLMVLKVLQTEGFRMLWLGVLGPQGSGYFA